MGWVLEAKGEETNCWGYGLIYYLWPKWGYLLPLVVTFARATEGYKIIHGVPFFCTIHITRFHDVMDCMFPTVLLEVFRFSPTALLATGLVTDTDLLFLPIIPSGTIGELATLPTGVVFAHKRFRSPIPVARLGAEPSSRPRYF